MITANMLDYPEHRINFYLLLTSIITHTFQAFFQIPPASQVSNVVALAITSTPTLTVVPFLSLVKPFVVLVYRNMSLMQLFGASNTVKETLHKLA
jgi:hypothetical protein